MFQESLQQPGDESEIVPLGNLSMPSPETAEWHADDKKWDKAGDLTNFVDAYEPGPKNLPKFLKREDVDLLRELEQDSVIDVAREKGMMPWENAQPDDATPPTFH